MPFERYKLIEERSLAYRLFKRHHTHFNDIYWSHKVSSGHSFASTSKLNPADTVNSHFNPKLSEIRNERPLKDWAQWYSGFDDWTRMAAVIGIAGYLETYIAQISAAAFESTPSLIFGGGPKIDGASFLKHNSEYDLFSYTESLTRGDWQARISAYKKFFGTCSFENRISDLEKLRKLRNDAGHSFGRDIKSMKFAQSWEVKSLPKITDKKMALFLELVETIASEIEKQVAQNYIGQYEVIKLYHLWLSSNRQIKASGRKIVVKEFKKHFYNLTSSIYGAGFDLYDYYDGL
ncbi:hypothetical protein BCU84_08085 [Shewanella sp. 10N.286.51.B7]|uniref:hypothetical protein n=1 Tax=Shewanella sp. 10N.286.51.B7 TaxID=1880836 RepID=UPI000C81E937|nr:hypothetical protein [Shewanella sp. 10N.286.51.B7]PMG78025.1 hypothetical protein BCU84_08085 [Shewanella sp. 10N.286.51.B7]